MKKFRFVVLLILIVTSFSIASSLVISALNESKIVSFPTSYPVSYLDNYNNFKSDNQFIKFISKSSSKVGKYSGEVYRDNLDAITEIQIPREQDDPQLIRIITVDASNSKNTLNLLERFIYSNHGITTKDDQQITKIGNYEVAQIAFSFTDEEKVVYEVFSAIKTESLGWIITTTFTSKQIDNILSSKVETNIIEYNKLIASIQPTGNTLSSNYMRLKNDKEIDKSILDLNKSFNSKFNSSF